MNMHTTVLKLLCLLMISAASMFQPADVLGFGENWMQVVAKAPWSARTGHASVVFDGKMWVLGGGDGTVNKNDVWYSSDGINWNAATLNAAWLPRSGHSAVVFNNKMWVIGGGTQSDVWSSVDGITWVQMASSVTPADSHWYDAAAVFNNMLVVAITTGTSPGDLCTSFWTSEDGSAWEMASSSRSIFCASMTVFDEKLWATGGGAWGLHRDISILVMPATGQEGMTHPWREPCFPLCPPLAKCGCWAVERRI